VEAGTTQLIQAEPATSRQVEAQKKRLREHCREFESFMVSYLMKTMREATIKAEEPDNARQTYEEMAAGYMSKNIAGASALGIGDMLYAKLEPMVQARAGKHNTADPQSPAAPQGADTMALADATLRALDIRLK